MRRQEGFNGGLTPNVPADEGAEVTTAKSAAAPTCARCGMEKSEWSIATGVVKEGKAYCCRGCAEDIGCICGKGTRLGQEIMDQPTP